MKKLQLLPLLALMLAFVFSAFTLESKQAKRDNPLWYYKLSTTAGENDRTNYEALIDQDELCPGQSSVRCVIEAPEFGSTGTPDLSNMDAVVSFKP